MMHNSPSNCLGQCSTMPLADQHVTLGCLFCNCLKLLCESFMVIWMFTHVRFSGRWRQEHFLPSIPSILFIMGWLLLTAFWLLLCGMPCGLWAETWASLRGASALGDLWRFDFRSSLHQGTSHHRWSGLRGISESFLVHLSHFTEGNQTPNQLDQLPNKIGRTEVLPPILISFGLRIQNITCNHFILFLRNLWDF